MAKQEHKSYYELLRDPRWQRKRLEVMERAGFTCEECDKGDETLNVHHSFYEKNRDPWDYPDRSLHCLCEKCHDEAERMRVSVRHHVGLVGSLPQMTMILGFARAMEWEDSIDDPSDTLIIDSWEFAAGVGAAFPIHAEDVLDHMDGEHKITHAILCQLRQQSLRDRQAKSARAQEQHNETLPNH